MSEHSKKIIRLPIVKDRTGLSRSSIYLKMSRNEFPNQIMLGRCSRSVGWLEDEIDEWIGRRVLESRSKEIS